jgi:hypothetical protein
MRGCCHRQLREGRTGQLREGRRGWVSGASAAAGVLKLLWGLLLLGWCPTQAFANDQLLGFTRYYILMLEHSKKNLAGVCVGGGG